MSLSVFRNRNVFVSLVYNLYAFWVCQALGNTLRENYTTIITKIATEM